MLRLAEGINIREFQQQTGFEPTELFKAAIDKHRDFIEVDNDAIKLNSQGQVISNSLMADFIVY